MIGFSEAILWTACCCQKIMMINLLNGLSASPQLDHTYHVPIRPVPCKPTLGLNRSAKTVWLFFVSKWFSQLLCEWLEITSDKIISIFNSIFSGVEPGLQFKFTKRTIVPSFTGKWSLQFYTNFRLKVSVYYAPNTHIQWPPLN